MKKIKTELHRSTERTPCDDCDIPLEIGDLVVRVRFTPSRWILIHKKCARDLGSDLALEIARV